ncbi:MAG: [acyl-carrier-protein] S-malonyltransferase [Pelagibacteraceae bacterium TMED216]|nr:MAG: [acyl-carrier-protein] S-malonyltransferase [Pelagibacteraceae bacterium TMED216]|tara:strand:- start:974 stop:1903 length:930 start_codon:yes stop_codon:yes gene_type:complete
MKALLFPGQGSQSIGMAKEFYQEFKRVKGIFEEANDSLKYDLTKIIFDGPEEDLKLTKNTQPAILTTSFSIFEVLKNEFDFNVNNAIFYAGHSLGEYSALLCAEALNFSDAVKLVHERGSAMQEAVPVGKGAMLAIINTPVDEIEKILKQVKTEKDIIEIANDNNNSQIIVSGETNPIKKLQSYCQEKKIRNILLPVSAPFHCSLMKGASDRMKEIIDITDFRKPNKDIIANVNALPCSSPDQIKKLLIQQIFSRVRWRESIIYMINNGIKEFIEIGPGKVLTGLMKRISKDTKNFSINSISDIKSINV